MQDNYTPPKFGADSFNCPYCGANAQQTWEDLSSSNKQLYDATFTPRNTYPHIYKTWRSSCGIKRCKGECLWLDEKMVFPDTSHAPFPNDDLSYEIKQIYNEATQVLSKSPRSAAALLRLALEKLCREQGKDNKSLQENIDFLVREKGLSSRVVKAMDTVRIIGNEAVHPGVLDLRDDIETATATFKLINFIAHQVISEPKELDSLYSTLPDSKKRKDAE